MWWRIVTRCGVQILAGRLFISSVIVMIGEDAGIISKHPVTIGVRSGILLSERSLSNY